MILLNEFRVAGIEYIIKKKEKQQADSIGINNLLLYQSNGCPYCAGKKAWPGFNDLATKRPDVAADWDYELNGTNLPVQYTAYSSKKVWWICRRGHPEAEASDTEKNPSGISVG